MEIITNNSLTKITFSVTRGGNFCKTVETRRGTFIRTTADPAKFIEMMISSEESEKTWNDNQIKTAKIWWRLGGRFNEELYRKIKALRSTQTINQK